LLKIASSVTIVLVVGAQLLADPPEEVIFSEQGLEV